MITLRNPDGRIYGTFREQLENTIISIIKSNKNHVVECKLKSSIKTKLRFMIKNPFSFTIENHGDYQINPGDTITIEDYKKDYGTVSSGVTACSCCAS